jgi:hypothetical protein
MTHPGIAGQKAINLQLPISHPFPHLSWPAPAAYSGDPDALHDVETEVAVMKALRNCRDVVRARAVTINGPPGAEHEAFLLMDYCPDTLSNFLQQHQVCVWLQARRALLWGCGTAPTMTWVWNSGVASSRTPSLQQQAHARRSKERSPHIGPAVVGVACLFLMLC